MDSFEFVVDKFLGGTNSMSAEEIGGYILLLLYQFKYGAIPADPDKLRKISRMTPSALRNVMHKFQGTEEGYQNKRMKLEREKSMSKAEEAIDIPKKKARAKEARAKRPIKILFRESLVFDITAFKMAFFGTEYEAANMDYYHQAAVNYSDAKGEKRLDWIAAVRSWMIKDLAEGKFITQNHKPNGRKQSPDRAETSDEFTRKANEYARAYGKDGK